MSISIWELLWRMIAYAPRLHWADTLFWLFISGLPALPGLVIRAFFDSLEQQNSNALQSPLVFIVLLLNIGVARIIAIFIGRITKTQHRFTISSLLRHNLLHQLLQRPGAEPLTIRGEAISIGQVLSFFRDDAAHIEDTVVGTNEIFGAAVFAVLSLGILVSVSPSLTLLVFVPLVAIAVLIQLTEHRIKCYRRSSRQATQKVTGWIGELFSSVQAIQVSVAEEYVLHHFQSLNKQRREAVVQDQVFSSAISSTLENLVNLGTGFTLLVAAQSMTENKSLSLGDFALFVYYLGFTINFLWFLSEFLALTKQTEVSFERIADLITGSNRTASIGEAENALIGLVFPSPLYLHTLCGQKPPLPIVHPFDSSWAPSLHELRVEGLTYRYPGSDRGIENISFTLKRGSLTVITGRVGAGKTTLVRLLLGLLPLQSGSIYWNGQQVDHPAQFFVPPLSTYTAQVPHLFTGSLRDNLLLGQEVSANALERAITNSILKSDLAAMPKGLDTRIGAKGMCLSGGQRQRAAAARMLVPQAELLVFDDLSSALDVKTELQLWTHLFSNAEEQSTSSEEQWVPTYLVVSHRSCLLARADQILLLEDGKISTSAT